MAKGDINNDKVVDVKDAEMLRKAALGIIKLNSSQFKMADMDNDGQITYRDLEELREVLNLKISGDANGDGTLSNDDVKLIQEMIADKLQLKGKLLENADITNDGKIDMLDVVFLQRLLHDIAVDHNKKYLCSNKVTIKLDTFDKGEYLSWFVTTQAANEVIITLKDDSKTYFKEKKKSLDIAPPLAVGNAQYTGNNLVLEISIPESDNVRAIPTATSIITATGKVVGHSFNCCGEDWNDDDFNDFYVNIVGWKSKK
ncbi:MAG: dockerin type I repeat-containing protein [Clostridium sp.]|nr:dockerin type I repeat-containing protein [Clostridium sp.]